MHNTGKFLLISAAVIAVMATGTVATTSNATAQNIMASYSTYVVEQGKRFGIPRQRIYAIIMQESSGRSDSIGLAGEVGLMQMTQGALDDVNSNYGTTFSLDDLKQPEQAIQAGCAYLALLVKYFNGDLDKATQAYNAGPGAVSKNATKGLSYLSSVKLKEQYFIS